MRGYHFYNANNISAVGSCIEKTSSKSVNLRQSGHEPQTWMFDHVAGDDTTQEEMFRGKS